MECNICLTTTTDVKKICTCPNIVCQDCQLKCVIQNSICPYCRTPDWSVFCYTLQKHKYAADDDDPTYNSELSESDESDEDSREIDYPEDEDEDEQYYEDEDEQYAAE